MSKNNNTKIYVGADVGFALTKGVAIAYDPVKGKGRVIGQEKFPSRVVQGRDQVQYLLGGQNSKEPTSYKDKLSDIEYTVASNRKSENTRFDGYHTSSLMRVLTQHLMQKLGVKDRVSLTTGLPLDMYYSSSTIKNQQLIDDKARLLKDNVVLPLGDGFSPVLYDKVSVMPEGLGAYLDFILDVNGNIDPKFQEFTLTVVDIGGRTTDIYTGKNIFEMDFNHIRGRDIGVFDLLTAMREWLITNLNIREDDFQRLEKMLNDNEYRVRGENLTKEAINKCIIESKRKIFHRLQNFVKEVVPENANNIDKMLIVGGGANVFGADLLQLYGYKDQVEHPEFANARGFAKFALNIDNS